MPAFSEHTETPALVPAIELAQREALCQLSKEQVMETFFPYLTKEGNRQIKAAVQRTEGIISPNDRLNDIFSPRRSPGQIFLDRALNRPRPQTFGDPRPASEIRLPSLDQYLDQVDKRKPTELIPRLEVGVGQDGRQTFLLPVDGTRQNQPSIKLDPASSRNIHIVGGQLVLGDWNKPTAEIVLDGGRFRLQPLPTEDKPSKRGYFWWKDEEGLLRMAPEQPDAITPVAVGAMGLLLDKDRKQLTLQWDPFQFRGSELIQYALVDEIQHHRQVLLALAATLICPRGSRLAQSLDQVLRNELSKDQPVNEGRGLPEKLKGRDFSGLNQLFLSEKDENLRRLFSLQLRKHAAKLATGDTSINGGVAPEFLEWIKKGAPGSENLKALFSSRDFKYLVGELEAPYFNRLMSGKEMPKLYLGAQGYHARVGESRNREWPWYVLSDVPFGEVNGPSGQTYGTRFKSMLDRIMTFPGDVRSAEELDRYLEWFKKNPPAMEWERKEFHQWLRERRSEIERGQFNDRIAERGSALRSDKGPRDWRKTIALLHAIEEMEKVLDAKPPITLKDPLPPHLASNPGLEKRARQVLRDLDPGLAVRDFRNAYERAKPLGRMVLEGLEKNVEDRMGVYVPDGSKRAILGLPSFQAKLLKGLLEFPKEEDRLEVQDALANFSPAALARLLRHHEKTGALVANTGRHSHFASFPTVYDSKGEEVDLLRLMSEASGVHEGNGRRAFSFEERQTLREDVKKQWDDLIAKGKENGEEAQAMAFLYTYLSHDNLNDYAIWGNHDGEDPFDPKTQKREREEEKRSQRDYPDVDMKPFEAIFKNELKLPLQDVTRRKFRELDRGARDALLRLWPTMKNTALGRDEFISIAQDPSRFAIEELTRDWDPKFYEFLTQHEVKDLLTERVIAGLTEQGRKARKGEKFDDRTLKADMEKLVGLRTAALISVDRGLASPGAHFSVGEAREALFREQAAKEVNEEVRAAAARRLVRGDVAGKKAVPSDEERAKLRNDPGLYSILSPLKRDPKIAAMRARNEDTKEERQAIENAVHEELSQEVHDLTGELSPTEQAIRAEVQMELTGKHALECLAGLEDLPKAEEVMLEAERLESEANIDEAFGRLEAARKKRDSARAGFLQKDIALRLPGTSPTLRSNTAYERQAEAKKAASAFENVQAEWRSREAALGEREPIVQTQLERVEKAIASHKAQIEEIVKEGGTQKLYVERKKRAERAVKALEDKDRELKGELAEIEAERSRLAIEYRGTQEIQDSGKFNQASLEFMKGEEIRVNQAREEFALEQARIDQQYALWADRCAQFLNDKGRLPAGVEAAGLQKVLGEIEQIRNKAEILFESLTDPGKEKPLSISDPVNQRFLDELLKELTSGNAGIHMSKAEAETWLGEIRTRVEKRNQSRREDFAKLKAEMKALGIQWDGREVDYRNAELAGVDMTRLKKLLVGLGQFGKYRATRVTPWEELTGYVKQRYLDSGKSSHFDFHSSYGIAAALGLNSRFENPKLAVAMKDSFLKEAGGGNDHLAFGFKRMADVGKEADQLLSEIGSLYDESKGGLFKKIVDQKADIIKNVGTLWNRSTVDLGPTRAKLKELAKTENELKAKIEKLKKDYGGIGVGSGSDLGELPALFRAVEAQADLEFRLGPDLELLPSDIDNLNGEKMAFIAESLAWEAAALAADVVVTKGAATTAHALRVARYMRFMKSLGMTTRGLAGVALRSARLAEEGAHLIKSMRLGYRLTELSSAMPFVFRGMEHTPVDQLREQAKRMGALFGSARYLQGGVEAGARSLGAPWWLKEGVGGAVGMSAASYSVDRAFGVPHEQAAWNAAKMAPLGVPFDRYVVYGLAEKLPWLSKYPKLSYGVSATSAYVPNAVASGSLSAYQYESDEKYREAMNQKGITSAAQAFQQGMKDSAVMDGFAAVMAAQRAKGDFMRNRILHDPQYTRESAENDPRSFQVGMQSLHFKDVKRMYEQSLPGAKDSYGTPISKELRIRSAELLTEIAKEQGFANSRAFYQAVDTQLSRGRASSVRGDDTIASGAARLGHEERIRLMNEVKEGKRTLEDVLSTRMFTADETEAAFYVPVEKLELTNPKHRKIVEDAYRLLDPDRVSDGVAYLYTYRAKPGETLADAILARPYPTLRNPRRT